MKAKTKRFIVIHFLPEIVYQVLDTSFFYLGKDWDSKMILTVFIGMYQNLLNLMKHVFEVIDFSLHVS